MDIEHLDRFIDSLEHDVETATERLDAARTLRTTFDDNPVTAPLATAAPATPPQAKRTVKKQTDGSTHVNCPDCGERFHRQGIGPHRRAKHPGSAAKPTTPPAPAKQAPPSTSEPTFKNKMFRCDDCSAELPNVPALTSHALNAHRRAPRSLERTPVAPVLVAA